MNIEEIKNDPDVKGFTDIMKARLKEAGIEEDFFIYFKSLKTSIESEGMEILDFNLEKIYFSIPKEYDSNKLKRLSKLIKLTLGLKTMIKRI